MYPVHPPDRQNLSAECRLEYECRWWPLSLSFFHSFSLVYAREKDQSLISFCPQGTLGFQIGRAIATRGELILTPWWYRLSETFAVREQLSTRKIRFSIVKVTIWRVIIVSTTYGNFTRREFLSTVKISRAASACTFNITTMTYVNLACATDREPLYEMRTLISRHTQAET